MVSMSATYSNFLDSGTWATTRYFRWPVTTRRALAVLVLCFAAGCSSKVPLAVGPQVQVVFQPVQNPSSELCRDDTGERTDYIAVPLIRFVSSSMELNGVPSSEEELLDWAKKRYRNMAERVLWVQASPEERQMAERALLPLVRSLPHLELRLVDPGFTCSKQQKDK